MIDRILGYLKRRSDHSQVTYSRFGLPGDEVDERAPPTHCHVAHFDDDARQYRAFFTHSTRAAAIAASFGLACSLFVFIVFLFKFRWHDVDLLTMVYGRLCIVLLLMVIAISIHWQVLTGIKKETAMSLVPAIMVYSFLLVAEGIGFVLAADRLISPKLLAQGGVIFSWIPAILWLMVMGVQGMMLFSFSRARLYYEHKEIHRQEVRVADKGKRENPQMEIVYVKDTDRVDPMPDSDSTIISSPRLRVILAANDETN